MVLVSLPSRPMIYLFSYNKKKIDRNLYELLRLEDLCEQHYIGRTSVFVRGKNKCELRKIEKGDYKIKA